MKKSVTPATDTGWQGLEYGFKWWLYPREGGELVWMGIGFGGQRLVVFPAEQLIVTFTGWDILKDVAFDAEFADRVAAAIQSPGCRIAGAEHRAPVETRDRSPFHRISNGHLVWIAGCWRRRVMF